MAVKIRFAQAPDIGSEEMTEEIIRKRAYALFEAHGCEHGHDLEHWLEAEAQVMGKKSGAAAETAKVETKDASAA
jgi:IS5 family transposase